MSTGNELGIWSDAAGGFIETGMWSEAEAAGALAIHHLAGEEREDLEILAICGEHEEQPADTCEECAAEDDEDPDAR